MVRKLALAVSLALGTLSVPVHALGLGELSSKSTLNQNFRGDITLLSVKPEELDAVRVKLADSQAFARAGVERPFYLSLLKFEPTLSGQGESVIRVSSEFPIREPFLNFLIEVNWPNGRLLREYTVLLDPPTTTRRRPPKVASATKARQAAPVKPYAAPAKPATGTAPAVAGDSNGFEYGPVVANETAWSIAKKVRPRGVSMEQMMMTLLDANPQAFVDGNINRLRKGQILRVPALSEIQQLSRQKAREAYREQQDQWLARRNEKLQENVAESESASGADAGGAATDTDSKDQLRIATARPEGEGEAGAGDDNAVATQASDLKSRLIVARENAETSRQEAETLRSRVDDLQVRLQDMQKLLSLKDDQLAQLQDRVVTEELVAAEVVAESQAEVTPEPVEVVASEAAVTVADDYRIQDIPPQIDPDRIVEGGLPEAVVADGAAVESPVADTVAVEGVVVDGSGIQDIPKQIDPDLIVLETMGQALVDEVVVSQDARIADAPVVGDGPVEEIIVTEAGPAGEIVVEQEQAIEPEAAVPVDETDSVQSAEPPVAGMQPSEAVVAEPVAAVVEATTVVTEPQAQAESGALEAFLPKPLASMIEKNMVPFAAGGVLLVGLFGWLFARGGRKRDVAETLKPAAAVAAAGAAGAAAQPEPVDEPALNPEAVEDLPDSSFLDEFSPSDINALQDETGEVDPVSEADVYIAYGRYQQAEEMLRQAMNRDPDRLALKHKLLEVHYATRNAGEFSALAQEMVDAGQDSADDAAWARAQDMGRELAPENPLFASKEGDEGIVLDTVGGVAAAAAATTATVDEDTLALDDLELSELTAEFDEEKSPAEDLEAPSEVSIMLDLDEPSGLAEPNEPELPEPIQLDDISALDFELPETETVDATEVAEEDDNLTSDSLSLDSMMAQAEAAVDAGDSTLSLDSEFSADELQAQLDELSDLSVLDSELDQSAESAVAEPSVNLGLVKEDTGSLAGDEGLDQPLNLDDAFDADEGDDEIAEVVELKEVAASSEPVTEDEVATKLDLARAYVEMGDDDGARSILEEVVAEGNQVQRGDAETLLGQLG